MISTHDLALTNLDEFETRSIPNVHFQDDIREGRLAFDYILRDGVVRRSNGVALMRLTGLDG